MLTIPHLQSIQREAIVRANSLIPSGKTILIFTAVPLVCLYFGFSFLAFVFIGLYFLVSVAALWLIFHYVSNAREIKRLIEWQKELEEFKGF